MNIAVHLARHRRLLVWCLLSLLLHLLVLAWVRTYLLRRDAPPPPLPLSLRLVPRPAPALDGIPTVVAAPAPPKQRAPAPVPVADKATAPPPLPETTRVIAMPIDLLAPGQVAPQPEGAAESVPDALPEGEETAPILGTYRTRAPRSARLVYTVTDSAPGQTPASAGSAQLAWRHDGNRYRLRIDGVLGELGSEGIIGDTGIAPSRATEPAGETRFDPATRQVEHTGSAAITALYPGGQDRASVLMQLAGIGLAGPRQIKGVVAIVVDHAAGMQVARFQVMGHETVTTLGGRFDTVRLAQQVRAGEARFEVWLAPEIEWLPVQLRLIRPDGSVATQVATAVEDLPGTPE